MARQAAPVARRATRPAEEEGAALTHWVAAVPAAAEQGLMGGAAGLEGGRGCQLEVDLASLVFRHHHLFSLEHYMTRRLMELYHEYTNRLRHGAVTSLTSRLHTLYQETTKVEELLLTAKEEDVAFQRKRLQSYRTEIQAVRTERDAVSKFEKDLVKSILASWKDLRDLRKKQNYTITGHKVTIHKEVVDVEEDRRVWKYELEREFLEQVHQFEERKEVEEREYQEALERWRVLHAERREVGARGAVCWWTTWW